MIVAVLENDYSASRSCGIFDAMRINRLFRNMAIAAHSAHLEYRLSPDASKADPSSSDFIQTFNDGSNIQWQQRVDLMLWDERWAKKWEARPKKNASTFWLVRPNLL